MNKEEFIKGFAELFEDTDPAEIVETTEFQELDEWDSLLLLSLIAYMKTNYGKNVTGKEIKTCSTVGDLFDLVESK